MKLFTTLFLLSVPVLGLQAQETYLNADFEKGTSGFTFVNLDETPILSADIQKVTPKSEWFVGQGVNGHSGNVILSCAHRQYDDIATDNWMITPQLNIKASDAWLTWDAQSIHYDLRETYEVLVSTQGNDPEDFTTILTTIEAEDYFWQHHMISLADYAGKKIYIAFRHTSENKYLLAVDNIFVGELSGKAIEATDLTVHSCGNTGTTPITGTLRNTASSLQLASLQCTLGDGTILTQAVDEAQATLAPAEERTWHFDIPVTLNKGTQYNVEALDNEGNHYTLAIDSVYCTAYPRVLMAEKATSYWCTSCPSVEPFMYAQERRLGNQIVEIVAQYPANNGMDYGNLVYDLYRSKLTTFNLPSIFYNRDLNNPQYTANEYGQIRAGLRKACYALPTIDEAVLEDGKIKGKIRCEFAYDLDNSKGRYRLAFTLVEKAAVTTIYQENGCSLTSNNEYYYLPIKIYSPLHTFKNVARGTESAFSGIEGSIPATIEKGVEYSYDFEIDVPEKFSNPMASNMRLVGYVLNTFTGEPINASVADVIAKTAEGINQANTAEATPSMHFADGVCHVTFPAGEKGTITIYRADGVQVLRTTATDFSISSLSAGTYLVRMQSASGASQTAKIMK